MAPDGRIDRSGQNYIPPPSVGDNKADKSYIFDGVNVAKELLSFWKIPPSNNLVNFHTF